MRLLRSLLLHFVWKKTDITQFPYCSSRFGRLKYILRAPTEYQLNGFAPLLLFLHGAGERSRQNQSDLKLALKHGPWDNPVAAAFCVVTPRCPYNATWSNYSHILAD